MTYTANSVRKDHYRMAMPRVVSRDPCARCGVPGHRHDGESHSYAASIGTRF